MLLLWSFGEPIGPVIQNSVTPKVTPAAIPQSIHPCFLPDIAMPHNMTGIILKLFPSTCTGNETYFKHSYWQVVAATFEREITKYFQMGAWFSKPSLFTVIMDAENATFTMRLQRTRKA